MVRLVRGSRDLSLSLTVVAKCPDQSPELQPWNPGHDRDQHVYIGQGRALLLTSSATVHSIHISDGGKPVSPSFSAPLPWGLSGGMQVAVTSGGKSGGHVLWVLVRASGSLRYP